MSFPIPQENLDHFPFLKAFLACETENQLQALDWHKRHSESYWDIQTPISHRKRYPYYVGELKHFPYSLLEISALTGKTLQLRYLLANNHKDASNSTPFCEALIYAARKKHEKAISLLLNADHNQFYIDLVGFNFRKPMHVHYVIHHRGNMAFKSMVRNNLLESVQKVIDIVEKEKPQGFWDKVRHFFGFPTKAVVKLLVNTYGIYNTELFQNAFESGQKAMIETLLKPLKPKSWFSRLMMFLRVARNHHREIFNDQLHKGLSFAAKNNDLDYLKWLAENAGLSLLKDSSRFLHLLEASEHGQLGFINALNRLIPKQMSELIIGPAFTENSALSPACKSGRLDVVKRFIEILGDNAIDALSKNSFGAFKDALRSKRFKVVEYLANLTPQYINKMLRFGNLYHLARLHNGNEQEQQLFERFIHYPAFFSYLEKHVREFGDITRVLIDAKLESLHERAEALTETNPHAVFDIDEQEAHMCFYMLRHLIRLNDASQLDKIRHLLSIPKIREIAHRCINVGYVNGTENELLKLAQRVGNTDAATLLLRLPNVLRLAEQHQYYQDEGETLNLQQLANDRESSMVALSTSEKRIVDRVKAHYKQQAEKLGGIDGVMAVLHQELRERYKKEPAYIIKDHQQLVLPYDWHAFIKLKSDLSESEYNEALKAYYQNVPHTVFRYLSKPNPWMSKSASYVYINEDRTERWSTFEDYLSLIANFYLAARDETVKATDGYTVKDRIDLFFKQIALIGRAHNWDKSRLKRDKRGHPIKNLLGHLIEEEYDDLEGDKPSCYSGVLRRLFQSVLGHPLFKQLTRNLLNQEINEFVRSHYAAKLTSENRANINKAYQHYISELDASSKKVLASLNIDKTSQNDFIRYLTKKYGDQLTESPTSMALIDGAFKLQNDDDAHFINFLGRAKLLNLLTQRPSMPSVGISTFFAGEKKTPNPPTIALPAMATSIIQEFKEAAPGA